MNRFLVTAACVAAFGLATSSVARAQVVYGGSTPTSGGGLDSSGIGFSPFGGTGSFSSVYSPYSGLQNQGLGFSPFGFGSFNSSLSPYGGLQGQGFGFSPFGTQSFNNSYSPYTFAGRTMGTNYTPFGTSSINGAYSPYGGYGSVYNTNLFGGSSMRSFGYNPFNGVSGGLTQAVTTPTVLNPSLGFGGSNFGRSGAYPNYMSALSGIQAAQNYNALQQEYNAIQNNASRSGTNTSTRSSHFSGGFSGSGTGFFGPYNYNYSYNSSSSRTRH